MRPRTGETRHHVLQLRDFHHQAAFGGYGVLREDVQDEPRAVEHLDAREAFFEVTDLRARKVVVEYDHLGVLFFEGALDFVHLAFAYERGRAKILYALQEAFRNFGTGGFGEASELRELFAGKPRAHFGRRDAYQDAAFLLLLVLDCGFHSLSAFPSAFSSG